MKKQLILIAGLIALAGNANLKADKAPVLAEVVIAPADLDGLKLSLKGYRLAADNYFFVAHEDQPALIKTLMKNFKFEAKENHEPKIVGLNTVCSQEVATEQLELFKTHLTEVLAKIENNELLWLTENFANKETVLQGLEKKERLSSALIARMLVILARKSDDQKLVGQVSELLIQINEQVQQKLAAAQQKQEQGTEVEKTAATKQIDALLRLVNTQISNLQHTIMVFAQNAFKKALPETGKQFEKVSQEQATLAKVSAIVSLLHAFNYDARTILEQLRALLLATPTAGKLPETAPAAPIELSTALY